MFVTVFTTARPWTRSSATWVQSILLLPSYLSHFIILLSTGTASGLFSSRLTTEIFLYGVSQLTCVLRARSIFSLKSAFGHSVKLASYLLVSQVVVLRSSSRNVTEPQRIHACYMPRRSHSSLKSTFWFKAPKRYVKINPLCEVDPPTLWWHRGSYRFTLNLGARWAWVVNTTARPPYHPERDPVRIVQRVGWASGPVWTLRLRDSFGRWRTLLSWRLGASYGDSDELTYWISCPGQAVPPALLGSSLAKN